MSLKKPYNYCLNIWQLLFNLHVVYFQVIVLKQCHFRTWHSFKSPFKNVFTLIHHFPGWPLELPSNVNHLYLVFIHCMLPYQTKQSPALTVTWMNFRVRLCASICHRFPNRSNTCRGTLWDQHRPSSLAVQVQWNALEHIVKAWRCLWSWGRTHLPSLASFLLLLILLLQACLQMCF